MDFLDRFSPRERDRLTAAATLVRLGPGDFLIRRGERGGDLFRVAEGELQVVDTRQQPLVVLSVLGRGTVVGEMAFLDESVRSADVRAADLAVCQHWERGALLRLLDDDPALAVSFYRVLARMVSERSRSVITHAVTGGFGGGRAAGDEAAGAVGAQVAEALRDRLMEIEPASRRDRAKARADALAALQTFSVAFEEALGRLSDEEQADAGAVAARELHPYLVRSHLGELALDRPSGHVGDPQALAHLERGRVEGDGPLGEFIDEWLQGLPTARAFREREALAAEAVAEAFPAVDPLRLTVMNPGAGALLGALAPYLARARGEVTVIDGDREALARADQRLARRPPDLRVRLLQADLVALALDGDASAGAPQHVVVLDGLLDHLPDRVAAALLRWSRRALAPDGTLVATALAPGADDAVFRWLLEWPMVRRSAAAVAGLLEGAGFVEVRVWTAGSAGLVARARVPDPRMIDPLLADLETETLPS